MRNSKTSKLDRLAKTVLYVFGALTTFFALLFIITENMLFGLVLMVNGVLAVFLSVIVAKKKTKHLQDRIAEQDSIIRSGIVKQIYDAYKHDGFEFNLKFDKLLFEEYEKCTLDIGLIKKGHEILIEIDEKEISIIMDEETEKPVETQIPLSSFATIEELYCGINNFIVNNCD